MPTCRKVRFSLQPEVQYRALFFEIMDTILVQLKHRFKSVKDIGFVELLDCKQFHFYNFANNFPERSFQCLQEMYKFQFEFFRLRSELQVLYSHSDFRKNSIEELHRYMHENDLYCVFKEVHKLVILILTMPYSTASMERSFSALIRVKTYLRNTQGQKRLSNLSLMSIEKPLLKSMMSYSEAFYNSVIEHFCEQKRRAEFIYQQYIFFCSVLCFMAVRLTADICQY